MTWLSFWPPFSLTKLTTCSWPVSCKACRNLTHWSSDVSRSSKASFLSYTVLSVRTLASCPWFRASSMRRWSSSSKSGSIKSTSDDFGVLTADKMPLVTPVWITTITVNFYAGLCVNKMSAYLPFIRNTRYCPFDFLLCAGCWTRTKLQNEV